MSVIKWSLQAFLILIVTLTGAMNRKYSIFRLGIVAGLMLMLGDFLFAQADAPQATRPAATQPALATQPAKFAGGPMPLVSNDFEMNEWLIKAAKAINEKDYARSIQILQALVEKPQGGFVRISPRGYRSLQNEAVEMLGKMGADGLKQYRDLYEPKAQKKYENALEESDLAALQKVVAVYQHTKAGQKALGALGGLYFDRGNFVQAARLWQGMVAKADTPKRPLLMTKAALAWHLAGRDNNADALIAQLKKEYPQAQATLGGKKVNLAEFISQRRAIPISQARIEKHGKNYGGLGSLSKGYSRMEDCDVVLLPGWDYPPRKEALNDVTGMLLVDDEGMKVRPGYYNGRRQNQMKYLYRQGHLERQMANRNVYRAAGQYEVASRGKVLPAYLQPVVQGQQIIFRDIKGVLSLDMYTGQLLWRSLDLPMEHAAGNTRSSYSSQGSAMLDLGRYALTAGGGRIYTVYDFTQMVGRNNSDMQSMLAAVDAEREGALTWRIGRGRGGTDLLKGALYIGPPSYQPGSPERLFIVAYYRETYYLLCLNAAEGTLLWQAEIGQSPPIQRNYVMTRAYLMVGSPPLIENGRVYVATNSGVIAAFDAGTGQGVWAHQYPSLLVNSNNNNYYRSPIYTVQSNPMLLAGGTLIVMPGDSKEVVGLSADTGKLEFSVDRQNMLHLAGIDAHRFLLSGPGGVRFVSADRGKTLSAMPDLKNPAGRPAVTEKTVLLCTTDGVTQINLEDYSRRSLGAFSSAGLLGHLVSVGGKLIASNALGVNVFFNYNDMRNTLTQRMKNQSPTEKVDSLMLRARMAFFAGRFNDALKDFKSCEHIAESLKEKDPEASRRIEGRLRSKLYSTYVALANKSRSTAKSLEYYKEAQRYGRSRQEQAHMLMRLAKFYEKIGRFKEAVAAAQKLSEEYHEDVLVDVPIGKQAEEVFYLSPTMKTVVAHQWANGENGFICRLIKTHGRNIYGVLDQQAKAALAKARTEKAAPEALEAIAARWPHSQAANDALFAAAEAWYTQARRHADSSSEEAMAQATRLLSAISNQTDNPHRASAMAALVAIYTNSGWKTAARLTREELKKLPDGTRIDFADMKGTLATVLKKLDAGEIKTLVTQSRPLPVLGVPLQPAWALEGVFSAMFVDVNFRPLVIRDCLLVQNEKETLFLDIRAPSLEKAVKWKVDAGIDFSHMKRYGYYNPMSLMTAGLTADKKAILLADRDSCAAVSLMKGKLLWKKANRDLVPGSTYQMGVGKGILILCSNQGQIGAIGADGNPLWKSQLPKYNNRINTVSAPPLIGDGFVVVIHDANRAYSIFDLKTGKLQYRSPRLSHTLSIRLTPNGSHLVTMENKMLTVRSAKQWDKPVGRQAYQKFNMPMLLGVSGQYILTAPDRNANSNDGKIDIWPIHRVGNDKPISIKLGQHNNQTLSAIKAGFFNNKLYLICSKNGYHYSSYYPGRLSSARGMIVQAWDVQNGEKLWESWPDEKEPALQMMTRLPYPLIMTQGKLVLPYRATSQNDMGLFILDRKKGRLLQKFELGKAKNWNNDMSRRYRQVGQAVVINNRLCVETLEGMTNFKSP